MNDPHPRADEHDGHLIVDCEQCGEDIHEGIPHECPMGGIVEVAWVNGPPPPGLPGDPRSN